MMRPVSTTEFRRRMLAALMAREIAAALVAAR
jgi:hypothetical protein